MKNNLKRYYHRLPGLLIFSLVFIAACASAPTSPPSQSPGSIPGPTTTPAGPTAASVQAYTGPITESMLAALNSNDYAGFSKDLDQTAKSAITQAVFSQLYDQLKATIGSYKSVLFFGYSVQGPNTTASYIAHFTNEPAGVTVTAVFQTINSRHYVHGFTLDSPKLRGQSIDVSTIRSYTDAATENILVSLKNGDYTGFSKDLNQQMKSAMSQTSFSQLYNMIKTKAGNYVSMEFESVAIQNNIVAAKYLAQYSDEPAGVWVTISFDSSQKVAGLFFNSPKINGQ